MRSRSLRGTALIAVMAASRLNSYLFQSSFPFLA